MYLPIKETILLYKEQLNKQIIFSVNLIAAMGAIANIARQRPDYMSRVVQTFEALQGNSLKRVIWNRIIIHIVVDSQSTPNSRRFPS